MIDTHAHLNSNDYKEDLDEVLNRSLESGIKKIIIPSVEPKDFEEIKILTEKYEYIYSAYGIHPHNAGENTLENQKYLRNFISHNKCVAIGEIGLDYYYNFFPQEIQLENFKYQLDLAKKVNLPVIVHNRDSDEDLINTLQENQDGNLRGVLHCFSSNIEFLDKALELGFNISFTANITFKNTRLDEVVRHAPIDRILIETDSPYMTPPPKRGKRNEPVNLIRVAEKISEIKSITLNEVIKMTTQNAQRLFKTLALLVFILISTNLCLSQEDQQHKIPIQQKEFDKNLDKNLDKNKNKASDKQASLSQSDTAEIEISEAELNYSKGLGINLFIGTMTSVDNQYKKMGQASITYEGLFALGGRFMCGLFDFMILEASYSYAKNTKPIELGFQTGPNIHQAIDLSINFLANPHSRINFFGTAGFSYFINTIDKGGIYDEIRGRQGEHKNSRIGLNTGLGFLLNLYFKKVGLMNITAEWRLQFPFGKYDAIEFIDKTPYPMQVSSFISVPRFGITWYPEFLYKLVH